MLDASGPGVGEGVPADAEQPRASERASEGRRFVVMGKRGSFGAATRCCEAKGVVAA
jgi:hypothetical protein